MKNMEVNIKNRKYLKRVLATVAIGVIAVGSRGMVNSALANNYTDTAFGFDYNGDGSDLSTEMRSKTDSSATYVFNNASGSATISVAVAGVKKYSSYASPFASEYLGNYYSVKPGNRKYMPNSMYPTYKWAYLVMASSDHQAHHLSGKWSPDNCSGY